MRKIVLTGGPYAGKSTLLEHLRGQGFAVAPEAAIRVIEELTSELGLDEQLRWRAAHWAEFQARVARLQLEIEAEAAATGAALVFLDRGLHDGIAYCRYHGVEPPALLRDAVRRTRYDAVILLDTLASFERRAETGRMDGLAASVVVRDLIRDVYEEYGYTPVFVPQLPVAERGEQVAKIALP